MRAQLPVRPPLECRRLLRLGGGAVLFCFLAVAVAGPVGWTLLACWTVANGFLAGTAALWGVFHPRGVLAARDAAYRWAFWLTLLGILALASGLEAGLAALERAGILPVPSSSVLIVLSLALCPIAYLLCVGLGLVGGAIGLLAGRDRLAPDRAAQVGTGSGWLATLAAALLLSLLALWQELPRDRLAAAALGLIAGIPFFTIWLCLMAQQPGGDPQQLATRVVDGLADRLVWRPTLAGRRRVIDMRGAALGATAAALAIGLAPALLAPLQYRVLASLLQFRNALHLSRSEAGGGGDRDRIVLLAMDPETRRAALVSRSEAAIQAAAIRRLAAWGTTRIILPLPLLSADWAEPRPLDRPAVSDAPEPSAASVARTLRDLPVLAAAMRAAGTVLLAVPGRPGEQMLARGRFELGAAAAPSPPPGLPPELRAAIRQLSAPARETGSPNLDLFDGIRLPVVATNWQARRRETDVYRFPPAPILLLAAARGRPPVVRSLPGPADSVEIAGTRLPEIRPGEVLVDFHGMGPGRAFPSLAYSSVLHDEPLSLQPTARLGLDAGVSREQHLVRPEEYFRGKMVFLDGLERPERETPLGAMPRGEVLAQATATLLAGRSVRRPGPLPAILWTLLFGAFIGHLCLQKDPLDGGWRVAIAVFSVIALAILEIDEGVWLDPVVPITAAAGAFLLVTQFTFVLARRKQEQRRRLLERMVGSEWAALLEDTDSNPEIGRRQRICVLFADLRSFTRFAEQHTPDEVMEVINRYMKAMTSALLAHGGILDKFTGDGLMAVFPVSESPQEDVARAVRAAMAMQDAAAGVSAELAAEGRTALQVGIGLHYGEAIMGFVGPEDRSNYTALGHTVVVSHRLQALARGGEVVISEDVYRELAGALPAVPDTPVQVKGISTPVRPYRVGSPPGVLAPNAAQEPAAPESDDTWA
jgi:adenylate cyclase